MRVRDGTSSMLSSSNFNNTGSSKSVTPRRTGAFLTRNISMRASWLPIL